jgi:hypothetical protein
MQGSRGGFWTLASYATAGVIVAFWTAYWPASAGNVLTKLTVASKQMTPVSDVSAQPDKVDRLPGVSFEERWRAMPAPQAAKHRDRQSQHESTQGNERAERIPFSCEMAFSRLVTEGNFSTRCIASLDKLTKVAAAE